MLTTLLAATAVLTPAPNPTNTNPADPTPTQPPPTWQLEIPGHLPKITFVDIPAGQITLEGKTHRIPPLAVATTELTWDVYDIYAYRLDITQEEAATEAVIKSRPSKPYGAPDRGFGRKGYAALGLTYQSALAFCEWLSKKTGRKVRPLTEAEWVYAAQAGNPQLPTPLDDYAWHWDNADDKAHPVGSKKPNPWGLYDTLGNVAEWVSVPGAEPVTKGGHFYTKPDELSFALRMPYDPAWQERDAHVPKSKWWLSDGEMIGLRIAIEK